MPAIAPSLRIGVPAATSRAPIEKQMTIAVPMSGCFISSAQAAPTTSSSGLTSPPMLRTEAGRAASSWAAYRISDTFSSSEGWNCSGPAPSQRVAPFTVTPKPGIITSTVSPNEATSSMGARPRMTFRPCREAKCIATSPSSPRTT